MGKVFFLIVGSILAGIANSQKIKSDEVDEFTKSRKIISESIKLSANYTPFITCSALCFEVDGIKDTSTFFYVTFGSTRVTSFDDNKKMYLKFADGSIFSRPHAGKYQIVGSSEPETMYIQVDEELLDKFRQSDLIKIRVETSNINFDFDVKEKLRNRIRENLLLVINVLIEEEKK